MNLDEDIRRGVDAKQVMQSAIYKEAFKVIEDRLLNELATIEIKPERAEYLRQLIVMGRKYRGYLEQAMLTGKMAEEQQTLMQRVADRAKRLIY